MTPTTTSHSTPQPTSPQPPGGGTPPSGSSAAPPQVNVYGMTVYLKSKMDAGEVNGEGVLVAAADANSASDAIHQAFGADLANTSGPVTVLQNVYVPTSTMSALQAAAQTGAPHAGSPQAAQPGPPAGQPSSTHHTQTPPHQPHSIWPGRKHSSGG